MSRVCLPVRAVVSTAALTGVLAGGGAWAAVAARAAGAADQAVASGTWAAAASPSTTTLTDTATRAFVTVTNRGTLDLVGATYQLSVPELAAFKGRQQVTLSACSGTWNLSTYACSAATTTLLTATVSASDVSGAATGANSYPAAAGGSVTLLLTAVNLGNKTQVTPSLTVKVTRAQARPARTTSS